MKLEIVSDGLLGGHVAPRRGAWIETVQVRLRDG